MSETAEPSSERSSAFPSSKESGIEPAILLVGAGSELEEALSAALSRHGLFVESASQEDATGIAIAAAPDLILLAGDAAKDGGVAVLEMLARSPLTSVVPVALLHEQATVNERLQAFRHGAVAVIPRSASIDAIADEVARLAQEIPDRAGASLGQLGESTLRDFVDALSRELRNGVLSVKGTGSEEEVRLVLGEGRPLAELVNDFVRRVQTHVVSAEPLKYEFDERAAGTVAWLGQGAATFSSPPGDLSKLPIALADPDASRADLLAQALRERGATIMVTDLEPAEARYGRLRQLDPSIMLMGSTDVQGRGYELVRRMRRDPRLRWTSLLVVSWDEVIPEEGLPSLERLVPRMLQLTAPERSLRSRIAATTKAVGVRLESIGPAHLLRLLTDLPHATRLVIQHRRLKATIDIAEHVIAGASATMPNDPGKLLEGPLALSALLQLGSGRLRIERVTQPASTNLMATLESALNLADRESPPIPASIPSPVWSQPPSAAKQAAHASVPSAPKAPRVSTPERGARVDEGAPSTPTASAPSSTSVRGRAPRSGLTPSLGAPRPASSSSSDADADALDSGWGNSTHPPPAEVDRTPHRTTSHTVIGLAPPAELAALAPGVPRSGAAGESSAGAQSSPSSGRDATVADLESLLDDDIPPGLLPDAAPATSTSGPMASAPTVLAVDAPEGLFPRVRGGTEGAAALPADTIVDAHVPQALQPAPEGTARATAASLGSPPLVGSDTLLDTDPPDALLPERELRTTDAVPAPDTVVDGRVPEALLQHFAAKEAARKSEAAPDSLHDMPSPGRDFDTLAEDDEPSPGALRERSKQLSDAMAAVPLERGERGNGPAEASRSATTPAESDNAPAASLDAGEPLALEESRSEGILGLVQGLVLKLNPGLSAARSRSRALVGLVAGGSLFVAFVGVLTVGLLATKPSGERAGAASQPEPESPPTFSPTKPERGSKTAIEAARTSDAAWPFERASDNPSPSCESLEKSAKSRLQRFPGASFHQVKLGRKALVRGDLDAAQLAYCRAIALEADNGTAKTELARLYILRRDGKSAEEQARLAMKLEPKSRILRGVLGDALARLGKNEEAREAWIYEAQADPSNHPSIQTLYDLMLKSAEREVQKGSWAEAERFYRRTAVLKPSDGRGAIGLAMALARLGEPDRALRWAEYAEALGGLGPGARTTIMHIKAEAGRK